MNNITTSQYMDKQIMDLSNSQNPISTQNYSGGNNDFIDFMNRPTEKKDGIAPSYDFMPIQPALGSSSPTAAQSSNMDSGHKDAPLRIWNSLDSVTNASPVRNYISPDADEPAKLVLGRTHKSNDVPPLDASLVSEIDRTMNKHMDNLMHAVDKVSAHLSQLETRTRNIESSISDLKVIVENNHGRTGGQLKSLENVLTEVQTGVQFIRDAYEIETKNTTNPGPTQTALPAHQQYSNVSLPQPPHPTLQPLNTPPPPPQQKVQPQIHVPDQFPQNPPNPSQSYQIPPLQHQYQPPPLQPQYPRPAPQPHPSFSTMNPSPPPPPPPPPVGYHTEETQNMQSQTYSPSIRPPSGIPPPSQHHYRPNPDIYEPPSGRIGPGPGYSGSFAPEPYPYSSSSSQSGYPQLPTARILPQALPTASTAVGGGPGSGPESGSRPGNRVPIDDVIDRVTNMGFPRDHVRETVRKLTENGQAVDLNVVLDKLMNDGNGQAPRGWFRR